MRYRDDIIGYKRRLYMPHYMAVELEIRSVSEGRVLGLAKAAFLYRREYAYGRYHHTFVDKMLS